MIEPHPDVGYVRAKVETLEREVIEIKTDVKDMQKDVKGLRTSIDQAAGAWHMFTMVKAALFGAIGAFVSWLFSRGHQ